ncbi:SET domain-containing protein 5 [Gnomoniopsis sp. IMI 355080]|nr:SET domain-containing protein 5 [Gnomoniopsis sp. IMI 355080]
MGLGLFAKVDIPRGARILAELPMFTMPVEAPLSAHSSDDEDDLLPRHPEKDIEDFVDQVDILGLDSEYIMTMETLCCNEETAQDEDIKDLIRNFFFQRVDRAWRHNRAILGLDPPDPLAPRPLELQEDIDAREIDRYARLHAIWANNRIKFGEGATMDSGVFLLASRINHSCCPNAWYDFNPHVGNREPRIEMLTTHAIRDIAAGEQILVGYGAMSLKLREERTAKLAAWDIYGCVCALCTDPLVEALQERAHALWQAANDWVRPWPFTKLRLAEDDIAPCKDGFEAVKMGEEVIALLTHPMWNVREVALAEAYKLCSIICERLATNPDLGLTYDEAVHYWERAMRFSGEKCQVYIILVGTDGREMKMADRRFKQLGERRARWAALQDRWRWPPRA